MYTLCTPCTQYARVNTFICTFILLSRIYLYYYLYNLTWWVYRTLLSLHVHVYACRYLSHTWCACDLDVVSLSDTCIYYKVVCQSTAHTLRQNSLFLLMWQTGNLHKLIERLTYHEYADTRAVRDFLITYRAFCTQDQLLDLLIKRYEIPFTNNLYSTNRDTFIRFKKEYVFPVRKR